MDIEEPPPNPFKDPEKAKYLPVPKGPKILVMVPKLKARTSAGLELPEEFIKREEGATVTAYVVKMGPDAYKGLEGCSGPYCQENEWVIMRAYNGTRIILDGWEHEFRLINDNTVEATIEDPTLIKRFGSIAVMQRTV